MQPPVMHSVSLFQIRRRTVDGLHFVTGIFKEEPLAERFPDADARIGHLDSLAATRQLARTLNLEG